MSSASPLSAFSDALSTIVANAAPSLVSIHSARARSSGFIWRDGLIITASEALRDESDVKVGLSGGETVTASLAGRDPTTDIVLLKTATGGRPPLQLGGTDVKPGALAIAVGAQAGAPVVAVGAVSFAGAKWRSMRGGDIDARIELDVRVRRSSEGGVALNADGKAFGMAVFGPRRRVLVIPAATIDRVAARLETHGRIPRGYLGLGLRPVEIDGGAGLGAMVMTVDPKGPGHAAGMRQGDIIIAWNGQPVTDIRSIIRSLGPDSVGTSVKLAVQRAGQQIDAGLTLSERPAA